jgi:hypothetical protein
MDPQGRKGPILGPSKLDVLVPRSIGVVKGYCTSSTKFPSDK